MSDTDQEATRDLADASRYIRTYAKDLAAAGGDTAVVTEDPAPAKPAPPSEPKPIPTPAPVPPPQPVQPPPPIPEPQPVVQERDAILARLKDRLKQQQPLPTVEPIRPTPAVFVEPPKAEVPPIPPVVKAVQPPPPPVPTPKPVSEVPSPIHTFKTDFADEIDNKKASAFSVLAAEGNSKERKIPEPKRDTKILPTIIGSIALVTIGAGAVFGAYLFIANPPALPVPSLAPSLVFVDERIEIEGPDYIGAIANLANEPLVEGNAILTYITYSTTTKQGLVRTPLPGGELIKNMELSAPDILLRNIDELSTVGIINAGGDTRAFFIMRVDSYQRTYAGMLSWESTMSRNLAELYPEYPESVEVPVMNMGTSTASSSAFILPEPEYYSTFKDEILQNHDVRVLRDKEGRSLILYGYRDKDTLIIARNEAAFLELVRRLTAQGN